MVVVLFVHPDLGIGGAERLVVNAALALQSHGHSVTILTAHHDLKHCFKETVDGRVRVVAAGDWLPWSLGGRCHALCATVRMLYLALYLVTCWTCDVVVVDQVSSPLPLLRSWGLPTLFYCHYPDLPLTSGRTGLKALYRAPMDWLEEVSTGAAKLVLVNSKFTAQVFQNMFRRLSHVSPDVVHPSRNTSQFEGPSSSPSTGTRGRRTSDWLSTPWHVSRTVKASQFISSWPAGTTAGSGRIAALIPVTFPPCISFLTSFRLACSNMAEAGECVRQMNLFWLYHIAWTERIIFFVFCGSSCRWNCGLKNGIVSGASRWGNSASRLAMQQLDAGDIFGIGASAHTGYVPPKQIWLSAQKGKGLEISGTWSRRNGIVNMEMTFTNRAMQPMTGFGIQLNKNSFGLIATQPLNIPTLNANQSLDISLPMNCTGQVQRMEPLTNIQVAIKNSVDIFYFACIAPMHIFFVEDGAMEKKTFLATWKDIPAQNEVQYTIENVECTADGISTKMGQNNAFTVAKRTLEGQDIIYQSVRLTNGIWGLIELKLQPGNPTVTLSFKSRAMDVAAGVYQVYEAVLHA